MFAEMMGWIVPRRMRKFVTLTESTAPSHVFKVGDLVNQRDAAGVLHTGRVVEINAEGQAARIVEEVQP